jgi:putative tryptophan/tyrosine transport system substrate-binding protein
MKTKSFFWLLATVLLTTAPFAEAQQPGKIFRIGFLDSSTASGNEVLLESFRQELTKLGWVEGKNLAFEYRFGDNKGPDRMGGLAADLVRLKVDIIVTAGAPSAIEAKKATSTIPIVMATFPDPVALGLVASLARPGGNVTGFTSLSPELNTKRLEVLKHAVPKLTRVGILRPAGAGVGVQSQLQGLRPAAVTLKLKLEEIETQRDPQGLERAFQTAKQKQVGAIMTISGRTYFAERKRIVELAVKYRLPAIYFEEAFVNDGGLMSYGSDLEDQYRKSAHYVDKILKGLPVQQPAKFEFIINLKTAKQIGLTLSPEFLSRANRVIK